VLPEINGAKPICPDFFIEIVEIKVIENKALVHQIMSFLWVFSVYPSHPKDFMLKIFPAHRTLRELSGIKNARIESSYHV